MDLRRRTATGTLDVRRARVLVIGASALAFAAKTIFAVVSRGPADVRFFDAFATAIARVGPVRVYEHPMPGLPVYNHPPLASWMLSAFHELQALGIPFASLIRLPACAADFVSALLVFEILRRRRSLKTAMACALACAFSPVLFATSAYHGNTDSAAVMFVFLAAYLLSDRRAPLAAGVAAALAVSVKLVPVVAVPALLVVAVRAGRPAAVRFCSGLAVVLLTLWGPVLATVPVPLREKVLEYEGGRWRLWGVVRFADLAGASDSFVASLQGGFHFVFVLLCMAAGAWLAWVRPTAPACAVALSLTLLLLLSTGSAVQYLAWPVVALCVLGAREAIGYGLVVGALTVVVYSGAAATRWSDWALHLGEAGWLLLAAATVTGVRRALADRPGPAPGVPLPVVAQRTGRRAAPVPPVDRPHR
ncbi:glycosyltransferase family 39 protein [Streptomyces peucetius]|uniref:Glycosyltransferase family 39 protein n=1 Tax=Streptomyces peucetius TaxID=1950 RepID=A0ABY6I5Y7_STRPE|nr:glycosyltransferase family 39 protein [Streptomyces peucetius]UYQ62412.1 glycosyltransferase family 39 protein [Streptomyces peucetius]